MTEREMLQAYIEAREQKDIVEEKLKEVSKILEEKESVLVEALIDKGATSTAAYDGLGKFTLTEPRIYASYSKENEDQVFSFVKSEGQDSIIKSSIHSSSLSSFVKMLLERGGRLPEFINYYQKQSGRLYREK